jgi:SAM-dependent methyltransferase
MNWLKSHAPLRFFLIFAVIAIGVWVLWHFRNQRIHTEHRDIVSFAAVKPVLEAPPDEVPSELKKTNEAKWKAWAQREDDAVHARLEQGGLDSMINVLLFGTSFTTQPRVTTVADPNDPVLQSRLDDLLQGLRNPGKNERLIFVRNLLRSRKMDPDSPAGYEKTKSFVLENLRRVVQEQITFRERFDEATRETNQTADLSKRSRVFRDRGISLDTTILSSFGIESALRDMKNRAMLKADLIIQVAVIGPGLDFTDKGFGYDFYPLQTLQPFALYDSLIRLGLAKSENLHITAFDISREVLEHLRRARDRAKAGENYVVQLPRESWPWAADAVQYWRSFGSEIGEPVAPIQPPPALNGLETRALAIRPNVILSCEPVDLNIILEQPDRSETKRFDLIIATNVFSYYDTLEQALALQNIATLLKPAGFLLTNDWLPGLPQIPMRSTGYTAVQYAEGGDQGDNVFWWQRQ